MDNDVPIARDPAPGRFERPSRRPAIGTPRWDLSKEDVMRIAIPVAEGRLAMHFGHCEAFALVDVDPESRTILETRVVAAPPHQPGLLPRWLSEQDAKVVIAGGMGVRAQNLFAQDGIEVVVGAPSDTPERIVAGYLDGTLEAGENLCDH